MTEYAILLPGNEAQWENASPEHRAAMYAKHNEFAAKLAERGHKVTGGAELTSSREAVVVELPPKWNDATHSNKQAWDCGIDDARMAIEAQGLNVEVKP